MSSEGGAPAPVVRIISIYATAWRLRPKNGAADDVVRVQDDLPLSPRLEEFHYLFSETLPRLIHREEIERSRLGLVGRKLDVPLTQIVVRVFQLPSDQVVLALDIQLAPQEPEAGTEDTVRVLDHCAFAQFRIDGNSVGEYVTDRCRRLGCKLIDDSVTEADRTKLLTELPPERHQIVFATGDALRVASEEDQQKILYRTEPPFRPEFIGSRRPSGLNPDDGHATGHVTLYTSLIVGHDEYIQNSVFLTGVQAVGTSARFRQIWHTAHGMVREFRATMQAETVGVQNRDGVEHLADQLGNLELELSFSVETSSDLGLLLPTLRSLSFHHELYDVMELKERAERVSGMFTRLASSIRSELTAIDIRELRWQTRRRVVWAVALNILSVIVLPVTVLLAYFGMSTKDVPASASIFDYRHYWPEYVMACSLALVPSLLALFATLAIAMWRRQGRPQDG